MQRVIFGLYLSGEVMLGKFQECTCLAYLRMSSGGENSVENRFKSSDTSLNLSSCKNLNEIYFMRTSIENLNITGCGNLGKVTIIDMGCGTKWIPCDFSKNTNLTYLNLDKNYLEQKDLEKLISDITPESSGDEIEKGTKNISEIILNRNNFSSLKPFEILAGKTSPFSLQVQENQLITLEGIENLTQLTSLDITKNNGVTNITPILGLKKKAGNQLKSVTIKECSGITIDQKKQLKEAGLEVIE